LTSIFMLMRNRRTNIGLLFLIATVVPIAPAQDPLPAPIVIDASAVPAPPQALQFRVGGQSPGGHVLSANDRYLMMDGTPWFPLMGEFHYSRYPENQWEKELLKIKAAGIQVISTYVFWIHHEEVEGEFNWTGQRDLRRFIELCSKHGLYVWLRIGPFDHGEVRNGGFPDWLLEKTATRENNPVFLHYVRRFDAEITKQVKGLFWKDGGPIIGIQLENEYSTLGPGKGGEYILRLRQIAREAGLAAPFYTVTGWDNAAVPSHDVLPVFGAYPDGFWWRSLTELPPTPDYFFTPIRCEENVDDSLHSTHPEIDALDSRYPFLTAEIGGGMEAAYHRRPLLTADDTAAVALVKLGSGAVGLGYYMFHGGTNPDGMKTTLQESQSTGYPNDLPVKTYDYQAPLGEFGQMHASYRVLKTLHLFLGDFGSMLAPMTPYFPERTPENKQDVSIIRVAARIQHDRGFIFINNHERAHRLPDRKNFQVQMKLAAGVVQVPRKRTTIPSDAYTIWPVNFDLGPVVLHYATAQLLCRLDDPRSYVFFAWPGIETEFAFENKDGVSIENLSGDSSRDQSYTYIHGITPGTETAIRVKARNSETITIQVLSREQALNLWKTRVAGKDRLVLSPAELYFDAGRVHLESTSPSNLKVGLFPPLERQPEGFVADGKDGTFQFYRGVVAPALAQVESQQVQEVGPDSPVKLGHEVALAPDESDFASAARWRVNVSRAEPKSTGSLFLQINYVGDVARLYVDGRLLSDDFYNGTPWLIGMDRIPSQQWDKLELKILPLREHAPIYLPGSAWPAIPPGGQVARLQSIQVISEYALIMGLEP
jgi:beta-galactosidase